MVKVGLSFERRRPRAAAEGDDVAGVGMGICSSGGSRGAIVRAVALSATASKAKAVSGRPGDAAMSPSIMTNVEVDKI